MTKEYVPHVQLWSKNIRLAHLPLNLKLHRKAVKWDKGSTLTSSVMKIKRHLLETTLFRKGILLVFLFLCKNKEAK